MSFALSNYQIQPNNVNIMLPSPFFCFYQVFLPINIHLFIYYYIFSTVYVDTIDIASQFAVSCGIIWQFWHPFLPLLSSSVYNSSLFVKRGTRETSRLHGVINIRRKRPHWIPLRNRVNKLQYRLASNKYTQENTEPKNRNKIFPKIKLRGLGPIFYIHVSVSDLYIPTIYPPILLYCCCKGS